MFHWTPYTFIRISSFFIGGILLGIYNPGIISLGFSSIAIGVLVACYGVLFAIRKNSGKSLLGCIGLPVIFLSGYLHVNLQKQNTHRDHLIASQDSVEYYRVVITSFSQEKLSSWKTEGMITEIFTNGAWVRCKAKLLLYFAKKDFERPFVYGNVLLVRGAPALMAGPSNPGEFNYKRYLSFRNIFHQHFLRRQSVQMVGHDPPWALIGYAFLSRDWCQRQLNKYVTGDRERAVASALVLGVTDGLDNDLLNAYSATGAMHVLAVSGLHISILYMIIMSLLRPLLKLKSGLWLIAIVSIVLLWLYAFITGLSPSVLRAVTMFSFVALARPTGRTTNIFNTLGASAFCLLLFDPQLIMSVGFQLSFLAVLGIVYLQPGLYNLWSPTHYLLDEIWKITCVSIAAQVATFSLGLLYFHQFPNYFLLSNLLVIPGSFVVLILGLLVVVVSIVPIAAMGVGFLLTWSIKFINYVVFIVESFPYSLVENIYINTYQSWLIMIAIVMLVFLFQFRKFYFLPLAGFVIVLLVAEQWNHHFNAFSSTKLTVYNVRGHTAFDLMENGQAFFFTDSALRHDRERIRFHIHPNRLYAQIQRVDVADALCRQFTGGSLIAWKGKIILLLQSRDFKLPDDLKVDFVIVGNNAAPVSALEKLKSSSPFIILDSSNSYFYSQRFYNDATHHGWKVHAVKLQGAYEEVMAPS